MQIDVKARHCDVPENFRSHAQGKLARLERLDAKITRLDVELAKEHNPRLSHICERVEITVFGRGPLVRAEANAHDPFAAFEKALDKVEERLRRAADRRARGPRGSASPRTTPVDADAVLPAPDPEPDPEPAGHPVMVVREKTHHTEPMTIDDALHNMELVGHDFYLFCDSGTGAPSVVYRRRGYDYGVLRLEVTH